MTHDMETVSADEDSWALLYRARGDEIDGARPLFTGDVFEKVEVARLGETKIKNIVILQHPCAMRSDGSTLVPQLLMAEVRQHKPLEEQDWRRYGKLMPLPALMPGLASARRSQAALFDQLYLVEPEKLRNRRIAALSQFGVNLLLQRWVHHNSRVVVPTSTYHELTSGVYEEADLIEEWCEARAAQDIAVDEAGSECVEWLREKMPSGRMRQELLDDPQARSGIRREMRTHLKTFRA